MQQSKDHRQGHNPVPLNNCLEEDGEKPMEIDHQECDSASMETTLERVNDSKVMGQPTIDGPGHNSVLLVTGKIFGKGQLFNEVGAEGGAESMDIDHQETNFVSVKKVNDLKKLSGKYGKDFKSMEVDKQESNFQRKVFLETPRLSGSVNDFHSLQKQTDMNKLAKKEVIQRSKRTTFEKGKVVSGEIRALEDLLKHQEKIQEGTTGVIIKELSSDIRNFIERKKVGNGVCGEVFDYQDRATGKQFALKKICRKFNVEEVRILMRLEHENIITLYGFVKQDRVSFILMEFAATNLEKFFLNLQMDLVDEKLIWQIIKQGLSALEYLDQNHIMHLDLKPDNICVTASMVVKLTDFGSAKRDVTEKDTLACTPEYMSPEMCYFVKPNTNVSKTDMPLTGKSDVFAFGLVIQYILDREHTQLKFYGQYFNDIGQRRINIIINNAKDPDTVLNKMITKNGNVAIRLLLERLLQGWPKNRHSAEQALSVMKDYMLGPMAK